MRPDPAILAFDSSAAHCAAALLAGGEIVATGFEEMARGQGERLVGLLGEVLAEGGLPWRALDAIGVGCGPGNFTGIRIAVACARGLALGLGVPSIGISTLEAQVLGQQRPVTSLVDARRGALYVQHFSAGGAEAPFLAEAGSDPGEAPRIGPGFAPEALAPAIARLAAERLREGGKMPRPAPLYIRGADAAPPRDPAPVILDG